MSWQYWHIFSHLSRDNVLQLKLNAVDNWFHCRIAGIYSSIMLMIVVLGIPGYSTWNADTDGDTGEKKRE
ncbi:hypothetical protein [Niveispirillum sp. BGYR6]|uniref:hypothetical protein n=1 Tax=Niveispirillum sp. BGYR6 TaxID=2971249 RepID=UPI0022B96883|nr:hypothetical protein [Niveispirillum sp. BGYR6]MDG5497977.1 hypothetical protein [Niveispirillum sp. BGYR6]